MDRMDRTGLWGRPWLLLLLLLWVSGEERERDIDGAGKVLLRGVFSDSFRRARGDPGMC